MTVDAAFQCRPCIDCLLCVRLAAQARPLSEVFGPGQFSFPRLNSRSTALTPGGLSSQMLAASLALALWTGGSLAGALLLYSIRSSLPPGRVRLGAALPLLALHAAVPRLFAAGVQQNLVLLSYFFGCVASMKVRCFIMAALLICGCVVCCTQVGMAATAPCCRCWAGRGGGAPWLAPSPCRSSPSSASSLSSPRKVGAVLPFRDLSWRPMHPGTRPGVHWSLSDRSGRAHSSHRQAAAASQQSEAAWRLREGQRRRSTADPVTGAGQSRAAAGLLCRAAQRPWLAAAAGDLLCVQ